MKRVIRGMVVLLFTVATTGLGVAEASNLPVRPAQSMTNLKICTTTTGYVLRHLMDGSIDPKNIATSYTLKICYGDASQAQSTATHHASTIYPSKLMEIKYRGVLGLPCSLRTRQIPRLATYYATGRVDGSCTYPQGMVAHGFAQDAGNGWIRFYNYYVQTGTYGYGDVPFSCGSNCEIALSGGRSPYLSWTGAQMWWSVNDNSYVNQVYCST